MLSYAIRLIFIYLYMCSMLQIRLIDFVYFIYAAKMLPMRSTNYEFKSKLLFFLLKYCQQG